MKEDAKLSLINGKESQG